MSRLVQTLVFLLVSLGITGALHYYLWARLVRDPALPAPWRLYLTLGVLGLGLSIPLVFVAGRVLPLAVTRIVTFPAYVWMGLMFLLFLGVAAADLLRLALAGGLRLGGGTPPDPARRELVARTVAGVVAAVAGGAGAVAVATGTARPRVREVRVRLERLPRELDGFTIAQLTDVHIGPTLSRRWLEDVVDRTNALGPSLVAITGDLVDGSVEQLAEQTAPLGALRAPHGTYFVTGNHEYYSGADDWIAELGRLGIPTLRNERITIGEAGKSFDLAGVDDWNAMGAGHGRNLARALAGRDPARELVLLAHQPRQIHEAARAGVGLQLSGHTHGGQIWPWNYLVYLQQPFVTGMARLHQTQLYVSPGTGFWGPPMRLGTRSEITRVVLEATAARPA